MVATFGNFFVMKRFEEGPTVFSLDEISCSMYIFWESAGLCLLSALSGLEGSWCAISQLDRDLSFPWLLFFIRRL